MIGHWRYWALSCCQVSIKIQHLSPVACDGRGKVADVNVLLKEPNGAIAEQCIYAPGVETVDLAGSVHVVKRVRVRAEYLTINDIDPTRTGNRCAIRR